MAKIKVLFVHSQLVCGGAEQALFDLISLLNKEKFDVTVLVQTPGGEWDQKFINAGIPVIYDYSCRKPTMNPVMKIRNLIKRFRTASAYKRNGAGLLNVILPERPDIVVSYSMWNHEELVFADGAKTVKYIHGDVATNHAFRDGALSPKEILAQFDRIVCVSKAAWYSFQEYTGLRNTVELHYNPLNSRNVRNLAQEQIALPKDKPYICAVGRLSAEKGFERLVVIHKRLLELGVVHNLVIVGDGPDREYIRRIIQATDTQNSVILAGYQKNPYPYILQSKFLVSSSFTEGLPVTAMEALCLGIPIVSAVPSIGEVFGQECCGLITENDNASLEYGIRKMLTDDMFYAEAKAGAERRSVFFDGNRMINEIEEMFVEMLGER